MLLEFMRKQGRFAILVLAIMSLVLVGACRSPQHRANKNPEAFAALREEWKALVLKGEIVEGMSAEGVLIAMGNPTWQNPSNFMGREVTGWVYTRIESYHVPNYEFSFAQDASGTVFINEHYLPMESVRRIPAIVVFIEDGVVLGWQDLDPRRGH